MEIEEKKRLKEFENYNKLFFTLYIFIINVLLKIICLLLIYYIIYNNIFKYHL